MKQKIRQLFFGLAGLSFLAFSVFPTISFAKEKKEEKVFIYAFQGDLKNLDPYALYETFSLQTLANVYEGLIARGPNLEIIPSLATSWELLNPTTWRFHLRKGVKFQNGNDFNADDVIFSAKRVRADTSELRPVLRNNVKVVKIDDYTVDFISPEPNPILFYQWDIWAIMDEEWSLAYDSEKPTSLTDDKVIYAARNTNGTGPFKVSDHESGVKTIFVKNEKWWGNKNKIGNLDKVILYTISSDATRVASLFSGEMDMVYPVPVQDVERLKKTPLTKALIGPELRTIYLNLDQTRNELLYSNIKGKNPFKDRRVRLAIYQAINIYGIKKRLMRNLSTPASTLISPSLFKLNKKIKRYPYDPKKSKKLLKEAGYPDGFEVGMDCPNDRYVNDEEICQAIVSMLAKVNIKVKLNAQPKSKYFAKVMYDGGYDTSMNLLGWTPGTLDAHDVLFSLAACRDKPGNAAGLYNFGGYCNKKVDALIDKIIVETNENNRNKMILEAFKILNDEVGFIPLHQQNVIWGVNKNIKIPLTPDNSVKFQYIIKS